MSGKLTGCHWRRNCSRFAANSKAFLVERPTVTTTVSFICYAHLQMTDSNGHHIELTDRKGEAGEKESPVMCVSRPRETNRFGLTVTANQGN